MNILMLLGEEFPPDNRVEKEVQSLIENGFKVTIACQTIEGRSYYEKYNGIDVYRLKLSKFQYKLSAASLILPFYFNVWKSFVSRILEQKDFDILHVHDLPLASVGFHFKKKFGIKLVCDQHEFYSNWIVHTAHYNTFLGKIVKWVSPWESYEKKYLNKADMVITVEEPLRTAYIEKVDVDSEKIICLQNTPSIKVFNSQNIDLEIGDRFKDRFVLFYAGGMDILRGIDVAIKALPEIKDIIPNVLLLLVGNIRKPYNPLGLAEDLGVEKYVHFEGWSPIEKLPSYITASDICFFTPPSNREEINRTIATKIYQYLQIGKPVIVGQAKMMKDFVIEQQIGYVINEENPEEFAKAVLSYHADFEKESEKIKRSCIAIKDNYLWEDRVKVLIDRLKSL